MERLSLSFKPIHYLRPKTEAEVTIELRKFGERGKIISGGTGVYEVAHRGLLSDIEALIDIGGLNLSYILQGQDMLRIGACTTMTTILRSKEVASRKELGALVDALHAIQPLQVKNVATIAGAVCTALPFFDLPVALLALKAGVVISPGSERRQLAEFLQGYFSVRLDPGEFVREVEIPFLKEGARRDRAFQKFARTHDDWALLNCGVSLSLKDDGVIEEASVIYGGGVGEKPSEATKIEDALSGVKASDEPRIKSVFSQVSQELETVSDIRASSEYRMELAKVIGARTTVQAGRRALLSYGE